MTQVTQEQSIWQNNRWTRMFIAYSISTFGDWFDMIAIFALMAYTWKVDPILIAFLPITFALPGIVFGSVAGVLADRLPKAYIMIIVSFISAILTFGLIFANHVYLVFPILLLRSTAGIFQNPAEQALTRTIVPKDLLLKATSYNQIVNQIAKIAGPLLGGLLLAIVSAKICLLINAISFVVAGFILLTIKEVKVRTSVEEGDTKEKQAFKKSWQEGWQFIYKNKVIFWSIVIQFVAMMVIQLVDNQFAILFENIAPDKPSFFGFAIASVGLGAVLSISQLNKRKHLNYGLTLGFGILLLGIGFTGFSFLPQGFPVLFMIALGVLCGIGNGMWMVTGNFILQHETPEKMVGRVFGIFNVVMSVVFIVAPLSGGIFIHFMGPTHIFQFVGITILLFSIFILLFRNKLYPPEKLAKDETEVNMSV